MKFQKFTLIELLVVIAIIAILAAMLLPALSAARARARAATCVSNLKNASLILITYYHDNKEFLPAPLNYAKGGTTYGATSWIVALKNAGVDMVLTANELTLPGQRNVYVRIMGPDGMVLSGGPDCVMEFEGDLITYSASREVDYANEDLSVSLFFDYDNIVKGVYTVEIYMDGYLIGTDELALN